MEAPARLVESVVGTLKRRQRRRVDPGAELRRRAEAAYREARLPCSWPSTLDDAVG